MKVAIYVCLVQLNSLFLNHQRSCQFVEKLGCSQLVPYEQIKLSLSPSNPSQTGIYFKTEAIPEVELAKFNFVLQCT